MVGGDAGEDGEGAGALVGGAEVGVLRWLGKEDVVEEQAVAPAVAAGAGPDLDVFRCAAEWDHPGGNAAFFDPALFGVGTIDVDALHDLVLDPALGPVEGDLVAFPGVEGIDRVAEGGAGVVTHQDVHGVLDVDVGAEDAAVAEITVIFFIIEVEFAQGLASGQVEEEAAFLGLRAGVAALVITFQAEALRHVRGVEVPFAGGENRSGDGGEPPVDQVEVVGRLVYHDPAGVLLVAVPAAEVVRAMKGVEQPVEIDRENVSDHPVHQELFDLGAGRGVAVVEGDLAVTPGAFLGIDDLAAFLRIDRHWLFRDDVHSQLHAAHDVGMVSRIHRGDDDPVGLLFLHHLFEIFGKVDRGHIAVILLLPALLGVFQATEISVAEADQFGVFGIGVLDGVLEHPATAAGPDDGVAGLAAGGNLGCLCLGGCGNQ